MGTKQIQEDMRELENFKAMVLKSRDGLKSKDKKIESLESELVKAGQLGVALKGRDASIGKLEEELRNAKAKEKENEKMIRDLEAQVKKRKEAQAKMADSFAIQALKLEEINIELEESNVQISSLRHKIELLGNGDSVVKANGFSAEGDAKSLNIELLIAKENLAQARDAEKEATMKVKKLLDEMELFKNEAKLAIEAEEKSRNAMEDLALALKEVATEANQSKDKAQLMEIELEHVKGETEQLKAMLRATEEQYQKLLDEAKQEAELQKNTADRLRLEAEEALLAWNGKEMCFVDCIKRAEDEKAITQHENIKLGDSLRIARDESYKLRDILKQAVSEANAAKASAGLAQEENSHLKDCLAEHEEELHFIMKENERLRMNETAAREIVKEYKKLLATASADLKTGRPRDSSDEEHENDDMPKTFSFNLEDLKFMNEAYDDPNEKALDEDPEKAEALKGSIFDITAETPKSEPHTPRPVSTSQRPRHSRSASYAFKEEKTTPTKAAEVEHLDSEHDDSDVDRNSHRKAKTMFQKVGNLLMVRRSTFHKKEPSGEAKPGVEVKQPASPES